MSYSFPHFIFGTEKSLCTRRGVHISGCPHEKNPTDFHYFITGIIAGRNFYLLVLISLSKSTPALHQRPTHAGNKGPS